ncbi:MAG: hypothetical protein OXU45_10125 [Candidatus Melainabacteria bacterium]|nr:hypothetical protein [Candidatus Melainabacteria bacterium]
MNVNSLNSNDSNNPLEKLVLYSDKANDAAAAAKKDTATDAVELDQAEASQFNDIKNRIKEIKDGDRAKLVAELREKFLSGQLNEDYSGAAVADAMLTDGYGEFLFS